MGVTALTALVAIRLAFGAAEPDGTAGVAVWMAATAGAAGAAVGYNWALLVATRAQLAREAQTPEEQSRRRLAEERLRIARELHDVLGHTMASISVQAGVGIHLLATRPGQAAEALSTIKRVGAIIADLHRAHGVELRLGRSITAVIGAGRVEHVRLDDGTVLSADLLVVAIGAELEVDLLRGSGLRIDGGGELIRTEHYSNAIEQGTHTARALLGDDEVFDPMPSFWCHIYGHRLQSAGFTGADHQPSLTALEPGGRFVAEYHRDGRLVGAAATGFPRQLITYRHLLKKEYA